MKWAKKIGQAPASIVADDIEALKSAGLCAKDIARVTQTASVQSHFAMSCSAAGVDEVIEGFLWPVLKFIELDEFAKGAVEKLTGDSSKNVSSPTPSERSSFLEDAQARDEAYLESVREELGWVPNLFAAVCFAPEYKDRHIYALRVLERPQTKELLPRHHAIARHCVCNFHTASYYLPTTKQILSDLEGGPSVLSALSGDVDMASLSTQDQMLIRLTEKLVCNAHLTTSQDVETAKSMMEWSDAGYIDFMNTVAIQDSFCRLSLALGIAPDDRALSF